MMSARSFESPSQNETEHGGEHQEQWKDRQKRIVGDEGCVATAAVLAESFGHAHRQIGPPGSGTESLNPG